MDNITMRHNRNIFYIQKRFNVMHGRYRHGRQDGWILKC